MRIAHANRALFAVLHLAVLLIGVICHVDQNDSPSYPIEHIRHSSRNLTWSQDLSLRDKQLFILQESTKREDPGLNHTVECCPSVVEMIEPKSGKNLNGVLVMLYRKENITQRFYERSCAPGIENKPCRFIDKKLYSQSTCQQHYSYSYALLENPDKHKNQHHHEHHLSIAGTTNAHTEWTLDYIQVRSGCRCVLMPKEKKKKRNDKNGHT